MWRTEPRLDYAEPDARQNPLLYPPDHLSKPTLYVVQSPAVPVCDPQILQLVRSDVLQQPKAERRTGDCC